MPSKEQIIDLYKELKDIPHLNLTDYLPPVPISAMLQDLNQFSDNDFYPYTNGTVPPEFLNFLQTHWLGMCLIENCREGKHHIDYLTTDNHELTFHPPGVHKPTDVGELTPNIINYLYSITSIPERTRLLRLMPRGSTGWHSHYVLEKSGFKDLGDVKVVNPVIQIPLRTNDRCGMSVARDNPREVKNAKQTIQHYRVGEVWLFNSYHFHDAHNIGSTPRDHIMMYASLDDDKLFETVKKAVNDYNGIRL
jgi:hypothetical protein